MVQDSICRGQDMAKSMRFYLELSTGPVKPSTEQILRAPCLQAFLQMELLEQPQEQGKTYSPMLLDFYFNQSHL